MELLRSLFRAVGNSDDGGDIENEGGNRPPPPSSPQLADEAEYIAFDVFVPHTKYATQRDANTAFFHSYRAFMEDFYKRKVAYLSDLYCCMVCIDVASAAYEEQVMRYWWLPVNHPVAVVLSNHFKADVSEGHCPTRRFGTCAVYSENYMNFIMEQIALLFLENGCALEGFEVDTSSPSPPIPEEEEPQEEAPPPPRTTVVVVSKKDD